MGYIWCPLVIYCTVQSCYHMDQHIVALWQHLYSPYIAINLGDIYGYALFSPSQ